MSSILTSRVPNRPGLPPLGKFLDVGDEPCYASASWIPAGQLPGKLGEMPPKSEWIYIIDVGEPAVLAKQFLESSGWLVEIVHQEKDLAAPHRLWTPNPFLEWVLPQLEPGNALDVGCGGGRDAVYMASLGWKVTALDQLPECLARGEALEARYADAMHPIRWECARWQVWKAQDTFDLIFNAFLWSPELPEWATTHLALHGHVAIESFLKQHREAFGRPADPKAVVGPGQLVSCFPNLNLKFADEGESRGRFTARLWAQRPYD